MRITLKAARVNAGYSQEESAKLFEISPKTLWNYENYKTTPKNSFVEKIPSIYKCGIESIIFLPFKCD